MLVIAVKSIYNRKHMMIESCKLKLLLKNYIEYKFYKINLKLFSQLFINKYKQEKTKEIYDLDYYLILVNKVNELFYIYKTWI